VLAALAGADAETLDVKKGGIVRLDVRDASQRGSATAIWSLKPKSKAVKKGLPVAKTEAEETTAEERTAKKRMKRSTSRRSAKRKSAPGIAAVDPQPASDAVLGADAEDATKGPADTASSERTADAPAAANDEARSGSESPVPPT
jgi:hypothetical protein